MQQLIMKRWLDRHTLGTWSRPGVCSACFRVWDSSLQRSTIQAVWDSAEETLAPSCGSSQSQAHCSYWILSLGLEVLEEVSREEYLGGPCREKYERLLHGFHGRFGDCQAVGALQRKGKRGQQDRTGTAVLHQSQAPPRGCWK